MVILVINFGLYVATTLYSMQAGNKDLMNIDRQTLVAFGGKYTPFIVRGEWWRLITAGFLHGGILHILMNSWALFDLGAEVEENYGTARLLSFYLFSTVTGYIASMFWTPALSIGSSAGIFGLIGAMIALGVRNKSSQGAAIRQFYVRWMIYGLVLGFIPGLHIDNGAHLGGLAGGFVLGYIAGTPRIGRVAVEYVWQTVAAICVLAAVYGFYNVYVGLPKYG
jgi:rhomboid protease GluP